MIDYDLFQFACPPCTGSKFIIQATDVMGIKHNGDVKSFPIHQPFPEEKGREVLRAGLVRNPWNWLVRCWEWSRRPRFILLEEKILLKEFYECSENSRTFKQFADLYLLAIPGAIGRLFRQYKADTLLRMEDMPWAFMELAESLGVPKPLRERCLLVERVGVNGRFDARLRERVLDAESEMCDDYEYR